MSPADEGLPEELEREQIIDLPSREALSIVDPGIFGVHLPQIAATPKTPEVPSPPTQPETLEA